MIVYKNVQANTNTHCKKTKHFRTVLIAKAFKSIETMSEEELKSYVQAHGHEVSTPEDNLRNAKILAIRLYDEMDYACLVKLYNYMKMCRVK